MIVYIKILCKLYRGDMTDVERKLELTRLLREEDRNNRMKLKTRENILYGIGNRPEYGEELPPVYEGHFREPFGTDAEERRPVSGFGIRVIFACLLFGAVVYLDRSGTLWNGKPAAAVLSEQVEENFSGIGSNFGIDTFLKKYYDEQEN